MTAISNGYYSVMKVMKTNLSVMKAIYSKLLLMASIEVFNIVKMANVKAHINLINLLIS